MTEENMLIKREEIRDLIDKIHKQGKTVVTTNGCFDILHVGHVRYLEKTKTRNSKTTKKMGNKLQTKHQGKKTQKYEIEKKKN